MQWTALGEASNDDPDDNLESYVAPAPAAALATWTLVPSSKDITS